MNLDTEGTVDLESLEPRTRRRLYWSCYRRALWFAFVQCLLMMPLYVAALVWCMQATGASFRRAIIAEVVLLLVSVIVGYLFVVAYVRQVLKARPGLVRFVLVRDPLTR